MHPVGNQPAKYVLACKGSPNKTGRAVAKRAHGVEKVRDHAGAGVQIGLARVVLRIRMAERHKNARLNERTDLFRCHAFRCDGDL